MALTAKNQLLIAFKKLVGKAHTNVKFGDSNESVGSNIQIDNSTIFSQPIPASPSSSLYDITNNIVEKVQFDLISIPLSEYTASFNASSILSEGDGAPTKNVDFSSGIHAFALKLPSNYETLSSNLKKGTGYFVNNQSLSASNGGLQIVPEKYNVASYAASVSSSSGIISFTDEEDYILDSYAGILFLQDINRIPTSVTAYLYVGDYLTERVSSSLGQFTTLSASVVSASSYVGIPSSTPGGANTQIQFNSGSTFSGSSNLIYDYTTNILSGTISQFTTISGSTVTSSNFVGNGSSLTNLTASNIDNFSNDVRNQFSAGTGIAINAGVISASNVPNAALTNSTITVGSTSISLGSTQTIIQGITELTASTITGTTTQFTTVSSSVSTGSTAIYTTISGTTISASTYVGIPSTTAGGANQQIQFNSGSTFSGSSNLIYDYTTNILSGTISQFTTISASVVTSSNFIGDGNNITNITASNISNFTNDVRAQFSQGTNITIVNGVISSTATTAVGGADKQIQFNSGSSFSGSSNLTYDYATGEMQLTGNLIVSGTLYANEYHTNIISSSIIYSSGSTKFGDDSTDTHQFTGSILGGIVSGTTAQFTTITGSVVSASTYVGLGNIAYITSSTTSSLSQIEIADFSNDVAVTFVDGRLKFIFGSPTQPSTLALTFNSTFNTDRFNKITDNYDITGSWNNGQYTIVTGAIYEGSTKLAEVNAGSSVTFNTTTSGSHTYTLQYTASSPLDGSLFSSSVNLAGTLAKTNPANPTITITAATIELGVASDQIEQGATGSISFTSASANPSNGWTLNYVDSNYASPLSVVGSLTGSSNIQITASAFYYSPIGDNDPDLNTTTTASKTYTKIRSLRYGASTSSSFTAAELEDIRSWDTTLGGTIGTIDKGNTNPSGDIVTITWTSDKYHYLVYDSARSNLSSISAGGINVITQFTLSTVGSYKIYKSNTLQAGGSGTSIIYTLT